MDILFICPYPNNLDKSRSIFVYRLVQSLAQLGNNIVVISPESWRDKNQEHITRPGNREYGSEEATIYRPKYFDFPNRIKVGKFSMGRLNTIMYKQAVYKTIGSLDFKPDVVYAHFLYRSGPAAVQMAEYFNVPAIVALGESSMEKHVGIYGKGKMRSLIHQFSGIVSVSAKNKDYCIEELGVHPDKIRVFPNSVDHEVFYPRDKYEMRKKYNLPQDTFITAFTGHFIDRKGPLRVLEAINGINGNIGGVFLGSGKQDPIGNKVLFKGKVSHGQVAELLSASDIFVLPTKDEGSCNAIVEAMACGLPVVSSDIEAIREQVGQKNGVLCQPQDVQGIEKAIRILYNDKTVLEQKRKRALETAKSSSIKLRATAILDFLKELI